jgi:hypothetical protein
METYERKICKLPGCEKLSPNWRKHFCCRTHAGQYSALVRHGNATPLSRTNTVKLPKKVKPAVVKIPKNKAPNRLKNPRPKSVILDNRKLMYRSDLIKLATPKWADTNKIQEMYEERAQLSASGQIYHVDHIIPLNHPLVCGLHVEGNLRVIPKEINEKKNNNFEV